MHMRPKENYNYSHTAGYCIDWGAHYQVMHISLKYILNPFRSVGRHSSLGGPQRLNRIDIAIFQSACMFIPAIQLEYLL